MKHLIPFTAAHYISLAHLTLALTFVVASTSAQTSELIRPGTSYSAARKMLIAKGYTPLAFPKERCLENASGRNAICEAYLETNFCAGTGLANCQFVFQDKNGALLLVETIGEEQDRPDRDIGLDLGFKRARAATAAERNEIRAITEKPSEKAEADEPKHDLNAVAFIMPSEWLIMPNMAVKKGDLFFRRYGIKIANPGGEVRFDPATFKVTAIDPVGSFINSQFFVCRRSTRESDTLTIHLPETVELRSFKYGAWHSQIEVRSLADGESRQTKGEYIKGDIFIDLADIRADDFIKLITASNVTYEFGERNDRIHFIVADTFGSAELKKFIRFGLPKVADIDPKTIHYFDTMSMLKACQNYKRTGMIPRIGKP